MTETKTDTWHMEPYFKGAGGGPALTGGYMISIEGLRSPYLPVLQDRFLMLELEDGVTSGEVDDLITSLNRMVKRV